MARNPRRPNKPKFRKLVAGERLLFTGTLYTCRDQAHKRLAEAIKKKSSLPLDLKEAILYYCGPTLAPKGRPIGSCGPTTASRMDKFTPVLMRAGLRFMIGKGRRSKEVAAAIKKHKGTYFLTYAGCGALLARRVLSASVFAYPELGAEAIYRLKVKDFPLFVGIDAQGRDIYGAR